MQLMKLHIYLLPNLQTVQTCILMIFCRIDKDRNGHITADELQQALSNGKGIVRGTQ